MTDLSGYEAVSPTLPGMRSEDHEYEDIEDVPPDLPAPTLPQSAEGLNKIFGTLPKFINSSQRLKDNAFYGETSV